MIKTILFDKDGTLFDFRATWSGWVATFFTELSGGNVFKATEMSSAVGFDLEARTFSEDSVLIAGTPGDIAERLLPFVPGTSPAGLVARMNVLAANATQQEATPLLPLLRDLKSRGLNLGVITNDSASPAKSHLRAANVVEYFDRIIGSDCGFGHKPGPGQLLAFMEFVGTDPSETLMVGDSQHDLVAARAAGCHGVGVLTGLATRSQLAPLAETVLTNISGLPEWLDQWNEARTSAA